MAVSLKLRCLTPADLPFADSLRARVGWNQTLSDWRRFLALEPTGCFLAEYAGTPVGTAITTVYENDRLAWIGMVLVHPDFRRRGIGRALLLHAIEYLQKRGVACIKLDATPAGEPVYTTLGFQPEWRLTRWEHPGPRFEDVPPAAHLRPWRDDDLDAVTQVDRAAFGCSRRRLLARLGGHSTEALVAPGPSGQAAGYGFRRPGSRADYVGPIAAADASVGMSLVASLLACHPGVPVFWDIPDPNAPAVAYAQAHGFQAQRSLTRMFWGANGCPGDPGRQFALAAPEVG